jgi:diguanylate cyclase (GGDEF)-like protein
LEEAAPLTVAEVAQLRKEKAQLEMDVAHLLRHDQLTGLLNRATFVHEVDKSLKQMDHITKHGAIIELGLRGLPRITGTLGRHAADYAISALAARLNNMCEEGHLLCRLDYWSFALYMPSVAEPLAALTKAKNILSALTQPIDWLDRKLMLDAAAGVTLSSPEDYEAVVLIQNAGLALKSATDKGGPGYGFFNPALAKAAKRRSDIQNALATAIEKHHVHLAFQPIYSSETGELKSFEALMRMKHPELGVVSPVEFIPVAEESGLIASLGAWAIAEACRVASHWPEKITISVNISPEQFYTGTLLTDVHNALELHSFPAYRLEVEVTESTMLKDSDTVLQQINTLKDMGCNIVLDDFGTGYSSLSYLWKFPFAKLKIDRSFVQALDTSTLVRGMLQSICGLARNLGLKITAEGIETQGHIDALREYKCDYIQGYLTGRPAIETDIAAIILKNYAEQLRPAKSDQAMLA